VFVFENSSQTNHKGFGPLLDIGSVRRNGASLSSRSDKQRPHKVLEPIDSTKKLVSTMRLSRHTQWGRGEQRGREGGGTFSIPCLWRALSSVPFFIPGTEAIPPGHGRT